MNPPQSPADAPFADVPDPLGAPGELPALPERVSSRRPTRAELRARSRWALGIAAAWLAAGIAWIGVREDLQLVSPFFFAALVVAPALLALLSLGVAFAAGRLGLGARVGMLAAVALLPHVVLLALVPLLGPAVPGGPLGTPHEILPCFVVTLGFAFLPLAVAAVALRRTFVVVARWKSALVGSAAGLAAAGLVNLHCDRVGAPHVLLGHLAAAVVVALLGTVLLGRITRA
ncbi:MAG TPA: NrsF family protein [Polyangiaceae bacterium]